MSLDPDLGRSLDEFGVLAEMARRAGNGNDDRVRPVADDPGSRRRAGAVRHVARPDFRLLVDTMHLVRSGHTASDLAAIDPALIGYVQLSDNTIQQRGSVYRDDSIDRMVPGEGELPLREIVAVLPPDVVIGLEVPMRSRAEAGERTEERARRCVQGARDLLACGRHRPAAWTVIER